MAAKIQIRTKGSGSKAKASKTRAKASTNGRKRGSTAKSTTKRTQSRGKAKAKSTAKRSRSTTRTKADDRTIKKFRTSLRKVGVKRDRALEAHEASVEEAFEAAQEALSANVPMSVVSDELGISRQWLYKMGEFRGRNGGGKKKGRSRSKSKR